MIYDDTKCQFPVVLFDVDGTLTGHRRKIGANVINALLTLGDVVQLGFVTGSPFYRIEEQLAPFFNVDNAKITEGVDIFPCNGTQFFFWDASDGKFACSRSVSMRKELGNEQFRQLIVGIQDAQHRFVHQFALKLDIPMCGNFIDYRESLLNWCPIGSTASFEDREKFIILDKRHGIRDSLISTFHSDIGDLVPGIVVNFGGQTSFDIFPLGWDKTFCLNTYDDVPVWFVGDRCEPGGNDFEIYELLVRHGRAYKTRSPSETVKIIHNKILPDIKKFLEMSLD